MDDPLQSAPAADTALAAEPLTMESLVFQHHRRVYQAAYRLTGRSADAEDLTQQTFLIAQERLHQIRDPQKAGGWLLTVLRNCYLKGRRKQTPLSGTELEVDQIPEHVETETVDRQKLQEAIDSLPDAYKIVLMLFYFEDRSYKEIAAELEIPIGTVMSRLTRAKGRLREVLLREEASTEHPLPPSAQAEYPADLKPTPSWGP